jgi:hypothetical protein
MLHPLLRLVLEPQPRGAGGENCRFDYRRQPRHRDSERVRARRAKAAWARKAVERAPPRALGGLARACAHARLLLTDHPLPDIV